MTLAPVFRRSLQLFDCNYKAVGTADELRQICFDAEQAFNTLMHFSNNQHIAWEPRQVGVAGDAQAKGLHGSIFWPGRVDAYLDRKLSHV